MIKVNGKLNFIILSLNLIINKLILGKKIIIIIKKIFDEEFIGKTLKIIKFYVTMEILNICIKDGNNKYRNCYIFFIFLV